MDSLEEFKGLVTTFEENDWLEKNHDYITMMVRLPFQVQMYAMFNLPFFSICYSFTKNFVWIFELFVLSTLMAYISY